MAADEGPNLESAAVEGRILTFLHDEVLSPDVTVGAEDPLLDGGLVDSMGALRLATFVEDEFRFKMDPADFVIENFQTVAALVSLVRRRAGDGASAP